MTRTTRASPPPDLLVRSKGPGTAPGPFVVPGVRVPSPAGPRPLPLPLAARSHNTPLPTRRRRTTCRRTSPAPADRATSARPHCRSCDLSAPRSSAARPVRTPRRRSAHRSQTVAWRPPNRRLVTARRQTHGESAAAEHAGPGRSCDLGEATRQVLRPRATAISAARPVRTPRRRSADRSQTVAWRPANRRLVTSRRETHGESAGRGARRPPRPAKCGRPDPPDARSHDDRAAGAAARMGTERSPWAATQSQPGASRVEPRRFELLTSALQRQRSTN